MPIKKVFQPVIELLEANQANKVKAILEQVIELASAKTAGQKSCVVNRNENNDVTHIFCYYHKQWENVSVASFGAKKSSSTGLNSMCKEGTSAWTKQQAAAKKANNELLAAVKNGQVAPQDIDKHQVDIETTRTTIIPRTDNHGTTELPK